MKKKGVIFVILTIFIMLITGCGNSTNNIGTLDEESIIKDESTIEEQGLIKYIEYTEDGLSFLLGAIDYDTMEEKELKCIWKTNDSNCIDILKADLEYAKNSETREMIKVFGESNSEGIINVYDIAYMGESLGGAPIWGIDAPERFLNIYYETGAGYYHNKIEENKVNIYEPDYRIDVSDYLEVTCDEAVRKIPVGTKISVKGLPYNLIKDYYNNWYFSVIDNNNSIEAFWYNDDVNKYQRISNILREAEETDTEIRVYGVYKENPNKVGEYNIYVHDVILDDSKNNDNNTTIDDTSDAQNDNLISEVTLENIESYKPTNVRLYSTPHKSFNGQIYRYSHTIYYDQVYGIEEYHLYYDTTSGKRNRLTLSANNPCKFDTVFPIRNAYIVGAIMDKMENEYKQSLPSEYLN